MTDVGADPGVLRLDDEGLASYVSTVARAEVELDLVVAGTSGVLRHRVLAVVDEAVVVLGVRTGMHQVMVLPPAHVAAALVRMTRLRPRPTGDRAGRPFPTAGLAALVADDPAVRLPALREVGAGFAWRLGVTWASDERLEVTAVDGAGGLFWADPVDEVLAPVSNTMAYRAFTTVLTAGDVAPASRAR